LSSHINFTKRILKDRMLLYFTSLDQSIEAIVFEE